MLRTRVERAIAAAPLVVIVLLAALIFPAWRDYRDAQHAHANRSSRSAAVPATSSLRDEAAVTSLRAAPVVRSAPVTVPRRPARAARVAIGAVRGSCWLLVRKGSASGKTLYEGILEPGSRLAFTSRRLWIRVGAGENLAMSVNGVPVDDVPGGVANVVATRAGVRPT